MITNTYEVLDAKPRPVVVPNPVREAFELQWTFEQGEALELLVYDAKGQPFWRKPLPTTQNRTQIDAQAWPKGLYFMQVVYQNGQSGVQKIMKF